MATHSSTLAWRIPRREKPGRLQSMGSQRVGHDFWNFLEEFEQDMCQIFSKFSVEFSCEAVCSGLLFVGKFLITVSIFVLVMGLLRFSISSWFDFGKLQFSKNLSIFSKLSTLFTYQIISVIAQSCPTICDPMNCITPGLPVHHQLPECTETHIHRVRDAIQPRVGQKV